MAKVDLSSVRIRRCRKPECKHSFNTVNRHHLRHEAMWFGVWRKRRRGEDRWEAFQTRYHEYRLEDTVDLCVLHHAEIHQIYDRIIQQDLVALNKPLAHYSWPEADLLMNKLRDACLMWLTEPSEGIDPKKFFNRRQRLRKQKKIRKQR